MLTSHKLKIEPREIINRTSRGDHRQARVNNSQIKVYINKGEDNALKVNSHVISQESQYEIGAQELMNIEEDALSNQPIEVMISTLSKDGFEPFPINYIEPELPLPEPKVKREGTNAKTLRMTYRKPALVNINGPPEMFNKTSFVKAQLPDNTQAKSWQQVPINLYKNPKIEKTLKDFFHKQKIMSSKDRHQANIDLRTRQPSQLEQLINEKLSQKSSLEGSRASPKQKSQKLNNKKFNPLQSLNERIKLPQDQKKVMTKRNEDLDFTPSAEKLNKTGNFFFKRGPDGKLNYEQYVGPTNFYNLIPQKGRNNQPRQIVYNEAQQLMKDWETSSVSTNSGDDKILQGKKPIYNESTLGFNSNFPSNNDTSRVNTTNFLSQRIRNPNKKISDKKKSDCMIVVENFLDDLRVYTNDLNSNLNRGDYKSQQIRAIITRRQRKQEEYEQQTRNLGDKKQNFTDYHHQLSISRYPYTKSTSPDMFNRRNDDFQFSQGLDQIDYSAQIINLPQSQKSFMAKQPSALERSVLMQEMNDKIKGNNQKVQRLIDRMRVMQEIKLHDKKQMALTIHQQRKQKYENLISCLFEKGGGAQK